MNFMQLGWLKVELCKLLEEKRSAVLRLKFYLDTQFLTYIRTYFSFSFLGCQLHGACSHMLLCDEVI